jgi:hypothetical protein
MATENGNLRRKRPGSSRRVVVLALPPVDEFDLVCPIQVFGAGNRLAGNPVEAEFFDLRGPGQSFWYAQG